MARRTWIEMVSSSALFLVVAAAGGGCRSSAATSSVDASPPVVLDLNGCFDGSNLAGISGCWYAYDDWYGGTPAVAGMGDCAVKGMFTVDQCSSVTTPVPGQPFTSTSGSMCTSGTAAKVIMDATGAIAYSAIWGAGIAFNLNNAASDDGGTGEKLPWDATAHNITGFSFHIDTPPVGGQMRVEFPTSAAPGTTDIKAAYWGGAGASLSPIMKGGDYSFHFTDVGGPMYLPSPMPFDKTKILSMQFHVVTNTSAPIPFSYCISDLRALTD